MTHKQKISTKINEAFAREKWEEARDLIIGELKKYPEDHWLLARLSTTYYEQRKYEDALKLIQKAHDIEPECPLVLWDLAGTLAAVHKPEEAMDYYMAILNKGLEKIANDPCGEGKEWAVSLLVDCFFRMGDCCQQMGHEDAINFYLAYLDLRILWEKSLYTVEDAVKQIRKLWHPSPAKMEQVIESRKELLECRA